MNEESFETSRALDANVQRYNNNLHLLVQLVDEVSIIHAKPSDDRDCSFIQHERGYQGAFIVFLVGGSFGSHYCTLQ
jgi:hypothetical protein